MPPKVPSRPEVGKLRPACGPRGNFVRPAGSHTYI